MDFIDQLPVSDGFMAILVVVDRLTKQLLFIPTFDTIDAPQVAQLFLTHVFSKHGIPGHVTSNCGTEFISHFFCSLTSLLNMKLHFTSGYHPEGNGQMEHINQVLEQYLCTYTNHQQDNWAPLLPLVEFTYNNATSETTRRSEEHTSELQSPDHLVCRLLLEKKKNSYMHNHAGHAAPARV